MRILHWYQNLLEGGGVANAVLALANAQSELGHEVLLAAMETDCPPTYESLVPYLQCEVLTWQPRLRLKLGGLDLAIPPRKLKILLNRWRPDIIHIHGEFLPANIWAGRAANCATVLTPHGAFHPQLRSSGSFKRRVFRRLYVRLAGALFYRRLRAIHALFPLEERQIRELFPGANIYLLPGGPSIQVQTLLDAGKGKNGYRVAHGPKLIYVGRLDVLCKGLDILLCAFAQAIRTIHSDDISLVLVGPDSRRGLATLRKMVSELGLQEKVQFAGPRRHSALVELLRQADVFVLLSRYEGFPLSLAEALIAGLPSIVSSEVGSLAYPQVASLPYVYPVKPGVAEAAGAIAHCIANLDQLKASAAEHTREAQEFFDWSRIARLHLEKYAGLLAANARGRAPLNSLLTNGLKRDADSSNGIVEADR